MFSNICAIETASLHNAELLYCIIMVDKIISNTYTIKDQHKLHVSGWSILVEQKYWILSPLWKKDFFAGLLCEIALLLTRQAIMTFIYDIHYTFPLILI